MALQKTEGVVFNPAKLEHRAAVGAYLKRNAWGDAGIRFAHDPKYGSLVEQVRTKMLNWYIAQETPILDTAIESVDKSATAVKCLPHIEVESRTDFG